MPDIIIKNLRNSNPALSPTDLEEGQVAYNYGVATSPEGETDVYIFIGNGSNTREDSQGNDLSGTISGAPTANKGWIRHSLTPYLIDGGNF